MARQIQARRMRKRRSSVKGRSKSIVSRRSNRIANNPTGMVVVPGTSPFPNILVNRLVYTDSVLLTWTSLGGIGTKTYRLNSLYDPDYSIGGQQPYMFDQLAAVYGRYLVKGAKITVTFTDSYNASGGNGPYICGVHTTADPTPGTSAEVIMSQNDSSWVSRCRNGEPSTVVGTYSAVKEFGTNVKEAIQATVGADPSRPYYAHVWMDHKGYATTDQEVVATLQVEYVVEWSQLADNAGS